MSFIDNVGKWLNDRANSTTTLAKYTGFNDAAADFAGAFTDNGENDSAMNDLFQFLKGGYELSAGMFAQAAGHGLQELGAASYRTGGNIVRQPLARTIAGSQYDQWKNAGETRQQYVERVNKMVEQGRTEDSGLSAGEAIDAIVNGNRVLSGIIAAVPVAGSYFAAYEGSKINPLTAKAQENLYDPKTGSRKRFSGTFDATLSLGLDPINVAGPAGKITRLNALTKLGARGAQLEGTTRGFSEGVAAMSNEKFLELLRSGKMSNDIQSLVDANTAAKALEIETIKTSRDPGTMAFLISQADTEQAVKDTLTIGYKLGTKEDVSAAADRLLAEAVKKGKAGETSYVLDVLRQGAPESKFAMETGQDFVDEIDLLAKYENIADNHFNNPDTEVYTAYLDALKQVNEMPAPTLTRALRVDSRLSNLMRAREQKRFTEFTTARGTTTVDPWEYDVTYSQPTPMHPTIAVISHKATKAKNFFSVFRPAGYVNHNNSDAYKEIYSLIKDTDELLGGDLRVSGDAGKMFDQYVMARSESERMAIGTRIEQTLAMRVIQQSHPNLTVDEAMAIYEAGRTKITQLRSNYANKGFLTILDNNSRPVLAKIPLLERATANTDLMLDMRDLHRVLNAYDSDVIAGWLRSRAGATVKNVDLINDIFKTSVLLRLGYTIRNLSEAALSLAVNNALGAIAFGAVASGEMFANFGSNVTTRLNRRWDSVLKNQYVGARATDNALQYEDAKLSAELRAIEQSKELLVTVLSHRGLDLDPTSPTYADDVRFLAELKGMLQDDIFYHTSRDGQLDTLVGDFVSTTEHAGIAAKALDDVWNQITIENFTRSPLANFRTAQERGRSGVVKMGSGELAGPGERFPGNLPTDPDRFPVAQMGVIPYIQTAKGRYAQKSGIGQFTNKSTADMPYIDWSQWRVDPKRAEKMAKYFDAAESTPNDPAVVAAYKALTDEVEAQYKFMTEDLGIKIEFVVEDPYASPAEMADHLLKTNSLRVYKTAEGQEHPIMTNEQNDMFRAVHDFFGHSSIGRGFDRHGEDAAWLSHAMMFSPEARRAMTTETRGQNSYYNYFKQGFAEQKVFLFPEEFSNIPKNLPTRKTPPPAINLQVGVGKKVSTGVQAKYETMKADLDYAIESGWTVQKYSASTGAWRTITRVGYYSPGAERGIFRILDPAANPAITSIRATGETVDMTKFSTIPADLATSLGIYGRESFKQFIKSRAVNTPEVQAILREYGLANGVGKFTLPDTKAWAGTSTLVLRDFAIHKGGDGRRVATEAGVKKIMDEGQSGFTPITDSAAKREQIKRINRDYKQDVKKKASQRTTDVETRGLTPIIPAFNKEQIAALSNSDIRQNIEQLANSAASKRAEIQILRKEAEESLVRREQLYGENAIKKTGRQNVEIPGRYGMYSVQGSRAGDQGMIYERLTSADETVSKMISNGEVNLSGLGGTLPVTVQPGDARYFEGWSNIINKHFRAPSGRIDPLVEMIFNEKSNEDIIKFLTETYEGQKYAQSMLWAKNELPGNIGQLRSAVGIYIPEAIKTRFLSNGTIDEIFLKQTFGESAKLPAINALLVPTSREFSTHNNSVTQAVDRFVRKVFRGLGSIPETNIARHPLYDMLYKENVTQMIAQAEKFKDGMLTLDEVNKLERVAREQARLKLNKTLFTIEQRTGAAQKLRLLIPFYTAWENVMRRWGGFAKNEPEAIARLSSRIGTIGANATLVDGTTGEEVKYGDIQSMENTYVILPFKPPGSKDYGSRVPLKSLDVLFQGQVAPGIGPWAALPFYYIAKNAPENEEVFKWAFPAGVPESALAMFMPTTIRRISESGGQALQGPLSPLGKLIGVFKDPSGQYINTMNLIAMNEQILYARGERPSLPTQDELIKKTNDFYSLRLITSALSPASIQYTNEATYYAEELRRLRKIHGEEKGDVVFLEVHPEAFVVLQSRSENPTGVLGTADAVSNLKDYGNIAAVANASDDRHLVSFIANYGQKYDPEQFSQAAYNWQFQNSATPGGESYRSRKNPQQLFLDSEITKGWTEYRSYMDQVDSLLQSYGIDPTTKIGANLSKKMRGAVADAIGANNKNWMLDYKSNDITRFEKRADFFEQVLNDEKFMKDHGNDPLMTSIQQFLVIRTDVRNQLIARQAAGTARGIGAQDNSDLLAYYNTAVAELSRSSIDFSAWFDRWFSNDGLGI